MGVQYRTAPAILLWQDRVPITDGIFFKSVVVDAPDDIAAIAVAQQLVDGHDVELWQLGRKIAKSSTSKPVDEYRRSRFVKLRNGR
jgi:hypothetical protein